MTCAVLIIPCNANGCVKSFHLGASEALKTRIINIAKIELGSKFRTYNDYLVLKDDGTIPLHKLLSWISSDRYELRSTMTFETDVGYYDGIKYCYEKYIFDDNTVGYDGKN